MEITLKNFRHHRSKKFILPESGMTLIKGKRGVGKSTIFSAIYFVLYGKVRRPLSFKAKTCSVHLCDKKLGLEITRTRTPNKLLVTYNGKLYEENAAQGVIDKVMNMGCSEFHISSYFDQRKQSSIFSMNPTEQLDFVSTIASFVDEYEEKKEIAKSNTKSLKKEYDKVLSKIELIETQISTKEESFGIKDTIEFPDEFDPDVTRERHKELLNEMSAIQNQMSKKRKELSKLNALDEEIKRAEKERLKLDAEYNLLKKRKDEFNVVLSSSELEELREEILNIKNHVSQLLDLKESDRLQKEYDEASKNYINSIKQEIKNITSKIMSEEELTKNKQLLKDYEEKKNIFDKTMEEINSLKKEKQRGIDLLSNIQTSLTNKYNVKKIGTTNISNSGMSDIKKWIEKKISELNTEKDNVTETYTLVKYEVKSCPECSCNLQMREDGELYSVVIKNKKKINKLQLEKQLSKISEDIVVLTKHIEELTECSALSKIKIPKEPQQLEIGSITDFQTMCSSVSEQENFSFQLKELNLKLKNIPSNITKLLTQSKDRKKGIPKNLDTSKSIEELNNIIIEKEIQLSKEEKNKSECNKINREISMIEKTLNSTKTKYGENENKATFKSLNEELEKLENESSKISKEFKIISEEMKFVEKYDLWTRYKQEIKELDRTKKNLKKESQTLSDQIEGSEGLESSAKEAEFIALSKTLRDINFHASVYMKHIFTEENITAELCIKSYTKTGKASSKPSIEVRAYKNGDLYDDIDEQMSGGERQLCDLAFLLGVNDMLGSKIILLDECLNHLDAETNLIILQFIKQLCKHKRVIIISHEAVTGVFDEVIEL